MEDSITKTNGSSGQKSTLRSSKEENEPQEKIKSVLKSSRVTKSVDTRKPSTTRSSQKSSRKSPQSRGGTDNPDYSMAKESYRKEYDDIPQTEKYKSQAGRSNYQIHGEGCTDPLEFYRKSSKNKRDSSVTRKKNYHGTSARKSSRGSSVHRKERCHRFSSGGLYHENKDKIFDTTYGVAQNTSNFSTSSCSTQSKLLESKCFVKKTTSCQISKFSEPSGSRESINRRSKYKGVDSFMDKKDPVIAAMLACEAELKPLKESLYQVKSQLRNLNMPELNCLFDNTSPFSSCLKKEISPTTNVASFRFIDHQPCPIKSVVMIENPFGYEAKFVEPNGSRGGSGHETLRSDIGRMSYFNISPKKQHSLPFKHSFTIPFSSSISEAQQYNYSPRKPDNTDDLCKALRYGISVQQAYDEMSLYSNRSNICSTSSGHRRNNEPCFDEDVIFKSNTRFNMYKDSKQYKNRSLRSLNSNMTFHTESCRSNQTNEDFGSDWTSLSGGSYSHCTYKHCQMKESTKYNNNQVTSSASHCPFLEAIKSIGQFKKKNCKNISTIDLDYPGLEDVCLKVEMKKPKKLKKLFKY